MNICDLITNNLITQPEHRAIVCGDDGREVTWLELDKLVNQFSHALIDLGVMKGDVVALYLPNSLEFIITYFAAAKIGAVALPFNIVFKAGEISYILTHSGAKVLVGSSEEVEKYVLPQKKILPSIEKIVTVGKSLEDTIDFHDLASSAASDYLSPVDCGADDLVSLVYTSGTSGKPKGAMLTLRNLTSIAALSVKILHINDQDLLYAAPPMCHIGYVVAVLGPFCAGAGVLILKHFNPEKALALMSQYHTTHSVAVPTMYIYMLRVFDKTKHDLSSMRVSFSAGSPMPVEYIQQIESQFGVDFCEQYGTTETCSIITYNRMGHRKMGSVGKPACGISVKVVDDSGQELPAGEVGEILVKGPGNFYGYWKMPEATKHAFDGEWYRTGDLGKFDEDKYLYIVDRLKDMIVSCGYNVYPREVEDIIYTNPNVLEAAVIGARDSVRQEIPVAYVRLKDNHQMTEQQLIDFCSAAMASYKVPRVVKFVDELPKGSTGKILKRKLQVAL